MRSAAYWSIDWVLRKFFAVGLGAPVRKLFVASWPVPRLGWDTPASDVKSLRWSPRRSRYGLEAPGLPRCGKKNCGMRPLSRCTTMRRRGEPAASAAEADRPAGGWRQSSQGRARPTPAARSMQRLVRRSPIGDRGEAAGKVFTDFGTGLSLGPENTPSRNLYPTAKTHGIDDSGNLVGGLAKPP